MHRCPAKIADMPSHSGSAPFTTIAAVLTRAPVVSLKRSAVAPAPAERTPPTWRDRDPLRGCQLCDFGRGVDTLPAFNGELCYHPRVMGRKHPLPVDAARCLGGACGPEASWMTVNGELL